MENNQNKINKKQEMAFNLNNFLLATSNVFDIFLEDFYKTNKNFLKKNAYISIKIGEALGLEQSRLSDLCSLALSYNLGLYHDKEIDYSKLPFNSNENLNELLDIVLLIDDVLKNFDLDDSSLENKEKVKDYIASLESFDEINKEILLAYFEDYALWCDIKNDNDIIYYIYSALSDFTKILKFEELLEFTKYFNTLINENSNIVHYAQIASEYYEFEHKDKYIFMLAASLKDIGKIAIKKSIYYKKDELSLSEKESIKEYPYYTRKVLNNIQGFNDISSLAYKVQERLDAEGYSLGLDAKDISFKDRILQIVSVFDSLKSNKSFRSALSNDEAYKVLEQLCNEGYLDKTIVDQLISVLK